MIWLAAAWVVAMVLMVRWFAAQKDAERRHQETLADALDLLNGPPEVFQYRGTDAEIAEQLLAEVWRGHRGSRA